MESDYPLLDACDPRTCMARKIMLSDRLISTTYRKHLAHFGLTASQRMILFVLSKRGPLKQSELAKSVILEKSSLSRNLNRLLTSNYVCKTTPRKISITEAGKAMLEKLIPAWEKAKKEIQDKLGEDGLAALNLVVKKLNS